MNSHEIDYEIIGDGMQMLEVALDPAETKRAKGRLSVQFIG